MRVLLFTDTLADVNGVARFITDAAREALRTNRQLKVFTSTPFRPPELLNIHNFRPVAGFPLPGYPQLQFAFPPPFEMLAAAKRFNPDVVHVSTPGPVGTLGRWFAVRNRLPLAGVYHTDFPEYVDRIIGKESLTAMCSMTMSWFYSPFHRVFSRSDDYARSLVSFGIHPGRILRLQPGIELAKFSPRSRDPGIWARLGCRDADLRVLYVGRVSVEKGLPRIVGIWPEVEKRVAGHGLKVSWAVVGDGPYKAVMERELADSSVDFLGFRHGEELAALYASADLFVFPSTTDTLGQVVLESQSSGIPVLVTDEGGPREVVDDGVTGFVLGAADSTAWATAIERLCLDDSMRIQMGRAAHEWAQSFTFERSFAHYWRAHEEIAKAYHRR